MANSFIAEKPCPITGLGTYTFTIVTAGLYFFRCRCMIPCDPSGSSLTSDKTDPAQSNLQIVLKQNSSTLVTVGGSSANPTPSQGSLAAVTQQQFAAGDTANVVLTSSNAIDSVPNMVKGTINLYRLE